LGEAIQIAGHLYSVGGGGTNGKMISGVESGVRPRNRPPEDFTTKDAKNTKKKEKPTSCSSCPSWWARNWRARDGAL